MTSETGAEPEDGKEPDARLTFANERTFLAWNRTALALVVAGLAIAQLLPPFPGVPFGRHLLAVPLICLGAIVSVAGYLEWQRDQRALLSLVGDTDPLPFTVSLVISEHFVNRLELTGLVCTEKPEQRIGDRLGALKACPRRTRTEDAIGRE